MVELVATNDNRAMRNKNNVLALYDLMINRKRPKRLPRSSDAEGKAVEHWDTLQLVGTPQDSAPILAPNIPRANANGMF